MKNKIATTSHERLMQEDDFIVSKTDVKGRITYANRIFMAMSRYDECELLGQQHNIVRHPDMPRGLFRHMWQTLHQGREFFGYFKNLAQDGAFYWTFANVTPTYDARRELIGYYSVRRKPNQDGVARIKTIYREMLSIEQSADAKTGPDTSIEMLLNYANETAEDYDRFILAL